MDDLKKDDEEYCVVCGQRSTFRFDHTVITPELRSVLGISDELANAFNREESGLVRSNR